MSASPTPAEIAAGLSEAQRETIAFAWAYPDYHRSGEQFSYCPIWRNDSSRRALERKGLIASLADGGPRLTPPGLAVRAHLRGEG
ncbi:hypothetical protein GCM10023232_26730 [Sphingosinicella ginsenosidimutans]